MKVLLHDWRGPRAVALKWLSLSWEWGCWHYYIDRWGGIKKEWFWESEE
jgi:hypothetical protein